jgi:uncharacterized protein YjbJ (UPF0337 family)
MADESTGEKLKGVAKETVGDAVGNDDMKHEGEAQQKKAQKSDEAERLEEQAAEKRNEAAGHKGDQSRHQ